MLGLQRLQLPAPAAVQHICRANHFAQNSAAAAGAFLVKTTAQVKWHSSPAQLQEICISNTTVQNLCCPELVVGG